MNYLEKINKDLNIYFTPKIIQDMLPINTVINNPPFINDGYFIKYFDSEIQKVVNVNFKCFEKAMQWGKNNLVNFNDEQINNII